MKNIVLKDDLKNKIKEILKNENFTNEQISVMLNKYISFNNWSDFLNSKYKTPKFDDVLVELDIDSTFKKIRKHVNKNDIDTFKGYLKVNNLSLTDAYHLYHYSFDHEGILHFKRTFNKKGNYLEVLKDDFLNQIKFLTGKSQFDNKLYYEIKNKLDNIKFSFNNKNIYNKLYFTLKDYIYYDIISDNVVKFLNIIKDYSQVKSLDKSLKNQIANNTIVYRAIEYEYINKLLKEPNDFNSLINNKIEDKGYSSTSLLYESSFANNVNYYIVFKILVPKGSQGMNISSLSNYYYEQEVLFNSNDLFVLDCNEDYIDKNGLHKVIYTALLLSKDRSCYKDLGKNRKTLQERYESEK